MSKRSLRLVTLFAAMSAVTALAVVDSLLVDAGTCAPNGQPAGTSGFGNRSGSDWPTNYFSGWRNDINNVPGSSLAGAGANIAVMNPWVDSSTYQEFSTAWVMLAVTGTTTTYAQAGWLQYPNQSASSIFDEWNTGSGPIRDVFGTLTTGTSHLFQTTYKFGGNLFQFWMDGNAIDYPNPPIDFTPSAAEAFSETNSKPSQMPGAIGAPESFENAQIWLGTVGGSGNWGPFNGTGKISSFSPTYPTPTNWFGEWSDGPPPGSGGTGRNLFTADWACAAQPPGGKYNPLQPARIWDTRVNGGRLSSGGRLDLQITGSGGIPASGVSSAALNITLTNTSGSGDVQVVPYGMTQPTASNINYLANQSIANLVEVAMGTSGKISIYNYGASTDAIVDAEGWISTPGTAGTDGLFNALTAARILDTRNGTGGKSTPLGAGQTYALQVSGSGGVPASGVGSVAINVTVTGGTAASYLTLWSDGTSQPSTSNIDFTSGQTLAHRDMVKLGSNGKVDIYNAAGNVNVIVDVNAWYTDTSGLQTSGSRFVSLNTPVRIYDSRAYGKIGPNSTRSIQMAGIVGSPIPPITSAASTHGVVLNITVTGPTAASNLIVFPDLGSRPSTSDINVTAGQTLANMDVVGDLDDYLDIYNASGSTDVIVDVLGFYD